MKNQETREQEDRGKGGHDDSHKHIVQLLVTYNAVSPAVEVSAVVLLKDMHGCLNLRRKKQPLTHPWMRMMSTVRTWSLSSSSS